MNIFLVVILVSLAFRFILQTTADWLNLQAMQSHLPPALAGIYDEAEYRKSQAYLRTTTHFSLINSAFTLVLLLVFWFTGGFNYLDQMVRGWGFAPIVNGLLYVAILFLAYSLITLPFSIYDTFVIEQRFGFNRSTRLTFFLDHVKMILLVVSLGGPLLAGVLALFQYAPTFALFYGWVGVTVFILFAQYIGPTWIMPLFNKFTPMSPGELKDAILGYSQAVKFPVKNIYIMDGSRRSTRSNAFFTGFGRNKRIALFDTLVEKHTIPELVAVLAHEIGHYKKKHIIQGLLISILQMGLTFWLLSLFLNAPGIYRAFYMQEPSVYTGFLFFFLLYTPLDIVLSVAEQALSRRHESEADRFASETVEKPESLIDALKKLSTTNLSNLTPHPFYVFLNYSHPPLLERIRTIQSVSTAKNRQRPA